MKYLSSDALASDPRNHAVPLLDHFRVEEDPSRSYMIMPLLRRISRPPFETVYNAIDFVDQILEVCRIIDEHLPASHSHNRVSFFYMSMA